MRVPQIGVAIVALTAAVVSFSHIRALALAAGQPPLAALLYPLSVDGAVAAGMTVRWADARAGRRTSVCAWALLGLGIAASLAGNIASAHPTTVARLVAAWPAVALALGVEVLAGTMRTSAPPVVDEPAAKIPDGHGVEQTVPLHAVPDPDAEAVRTIRELDADHGSPVPRRRIEEALGCGAGRATRLAKIAREEAA